MGGRHLRHCGRRDHRVGAPRRCPANAGHMLDVAAARRTRRAASLDGHRAGGDSRADWPAGRWLRVRAGSNLEHRQAAAGGAAADRADRPQLTYPDIRLVYWTGGNPFHHHQDLGRLRRAFCRPDTVIVHESAWTATARHADIVLPATITLEREDLGGTAGDPLLVAMHQAIAPYAAARDDHAIFAGLADRLGFGHAFTEGRTVRQWLEHLYEPTRRALADRGVNAPAFDEFWEDGELVLPTLPWDGGPIREFRRDPDAAPLPTPSGRIEIASEMIAGFGYADCPGHPAWMPPVEGAGS